MEPLAKKPKVPTARVLPFEHLYLERLPASSFYERSYMHRDTVSHVVTVGDYLLTASIDGHLKFWRRIVAEVGQTTNTAGVVEFLKTFRAHNGLIMAVVASLDGQRVATLSADETVKIFNVKSLDMVTMKKLDFVPETACWISCDNLLISDKNSPRLVMLDSMDPDNCREILLPNLENPIQRLCYISSHESCISIDSKGFIGIWNPHNQSKLSFEYLTDRSTTHLDDLTKNNTRALSLCVSPDQEFFCIFGADRNIRVFRIRTGKLYRKYDESISTYQKRPPADIDAEVFESRLTQEAELEETSYFNLVNCVYDESGNFILFSTPVGVKILNLVTSKVSRVVGSGEDCRFLSLALCTESQYKGGMTMEMAASANPALESSTRVLGFLAATAFRKHRFYLFTLSHIQAASDNRDIVNEKIIQDDSATKLLKVRKLPNNAIMRTTLGDIHLQLFGDLVPLAVENFSALAKTGYYDNLLFHRVIKGFMVQTGDPLGDGTGGNSIWGKEFQDEYDPTLRHTPFTVSMANSGRNTNGSQFFITTVGCPWLDDKHTVFGRVTKGQDVVVKIEAADTDSLDKPRTDIKILQIELLNK